MGFLLMFCYCLKISRDFSGKSIVVLFFVYHFLVFTCTGSINYMKAHVGNILEIILLLIVRLLSLDALFLYLILFMGYFFLEYEHEQSFNFDTKKDKEKSVS